MALKVLWIENDGMAFKASLQMNDVIQSYGGNPVSSVNDLNSAIAAAQASMLQVVDLEIARNGSRITLECPVGNMGATFSHASSHPSDSISENPQSTGNYGVARMLCYLISLFGGLCVGAGVLIAIMLSDKWPAVALILSGLVTFLSGQATKALLDIADDSKAILSLLKEKN